MKNHGHIILVLLTFIISVRCLTNYCNFPNCKHTLCIYPTAGHINPQGNGLTISEKLRILNAHNTYRQKVGSGLETRGNPGPQPAGAIPNLFWNDEIATIAQRWAEQSIFQSDLCRRTSQYPWVNQNLAVIETTGNVSTTQVEDLVQIWTDSVVNFNRNTVSRFNFNSQSATYSQVVWSITTSVGCGASKYTSGGFNWFYLVCNYAPGGNIQGQVVYPTTL